jgi:UDP-N-acetyl-2-amino-2-deoxyglucuronate dehydrogenase
VFVVHQLCYHPEIIKLREKVLNGPQDKVYNVELTYITPLGKWYQYSWKGDIQKSGGITTNIGIHFFDLLQWVFGAVKENTVTIHTADTAAGILKLEKAEVDWYLSINYDNMPQAPKEVGKRTYRTLQIDGDEFEFSEGFTELHTKSYEEILKGNGFPMIETKTTIQVVHDIRSK